MPRKNSGKGANGRGSIYQDKHGTWWAQLPPDELGRRPKRSAKTEQEAVKKLAELEAERAKGINLSERSPTVEQWLTTWLEVIVKPNVRPNVYEDYANQCRLYIIPYIGRIQLSKLSKLHVQQMLNKLRESGRSIGTLRLARARIKSALNEAIEAKLISENVAKLAKLPTADDEDGEMHILTETQALFFLAALALHRLYALYFVALMTGARQAELVGLRWSDVDFTKRVIHIKSQLHNKRRAIVRSRPKTPKSRRTIPMDDVLIEVLREHQRSQLEEKRLLGTDWKEYTLVFPSQIGTPLHHTSLHRHFKTAIRRLGMPDIRFHDLRHTAASLMLANGVPLADVSEILGHSNPAITARLYLHGSEEGKVKAIETMGRLLGKKAS